MAARAGRPARPCKPRPLWQPSCAATGRGRTAAGLLRHAATRAPAAQPLPFGARPTLVIVGVDADELELARDALANEGWDVADGGPLLRATVDVGGGRLTDDVVVPGDGGLGGGEAEATPFLGRTALLLRPPGVDAALVAPVLADVLAAAGANPVVVGAAVPEYDGRPLVAALAGVRAAHARYYGLVQPLRTVAGDVLPPGAAVAAHALVDAADAPWGEDASGVAVLDGLLTPAEAGDLLTALTAPGWDHAAGPPPATWDKGTVDRDGDSPTYGVKPEVVAGLVASPPPALAALESRLCALYRDDYDLAYMPAAAVDAGLSSVVANAVCVGDACAWHADADPLAADPDGPWAEHWGLYPNRTPGKPLFVSALVYLNPEWPLECNAETLFLDGEAGIGLAVRPRPGRVVLMDQDVAHRICEPSRAAAVPRYSLVLKLVFYPRPRAGGAAAAVGVLRPEWGEPLRLGSASRRGPVPLA